MNKTSQLGMILLIGMVFLWFQYNSKQAQEAQKQKLEQQKQDSLAHVAQHPGADTSTRRASSQNLAAGTHGDSAAAIAQTGTHQAVTVETHHFIARLDNEGAKLSALFIKDIAGKKPYRTDLITADKGGALLINIDGHDLSKVLWQMETKDSSIHVDKDSVAVVFKYAAPGVPALTRTYTFYPDSAKFSQNLEAAAPINAYTLQWPSGLNETERIINGKGVGLLSSFFSEVVLDNGVTVDRERFQGKKTFNDEAGVLRWVGLRRKYVAAVINFNKETPNKVVAVSHSPVEDDKSYPKDYELEVQAANYDEKTLNFDFLVLPLSYDKLKAMNQNYEKILFSGWERFFRADVWYVALCGLVLHLLNLFYSLIPNYGVAIILLTLLVRTLTFPLTMTQTKQAAKMTQHTPAIQKIREKHKGNPQKANLEIMEYYKKVGVNPLAGVMGCFPMFLQMPIFISLFNVLGRAVELKNAPFFGWVHDLALPDVVWEGLKVPYLFPAGITIMPFFMAASMFFQMKMTIKDPNQKMMVWMMPIMMFVFSCSFPSGLVLYWTVSNVFTIGQTYFYTNRIKSQAAAAVPVKARA